MLTAEQTATAADVRASLVARGVDPTRAAALVARATARAAELRSGFGACCPGCQCGGSCLGQTVPAPLPAQLTPAATPAAAPAAGTPAILSDISAAGNNPNVVAMQNIVSKWSWLIPVGGLLMSAKSKISDWKASKTDPAYAASKSLRGR
jgi:hypothetical protein